MNKFLKKNTSKNATSKVSNNATISSFFAKKPSPQTSSSKTSPQTTNSSSTSPSNQPKNDKLNRDSPNEPKNDKLNGISNQQNEKLNGKLSLNEIFSSKNEVKEKPSSEEMEVDEVKVEKQKSPLKHELQNGNSSTNGQPAKKPKLNTSDSFSSNKFMFSTQDYSTQFFNLYISRLREMTDLMKAKVIQKWGTQIPIKKLCDLREEEISECIIIATIFKHQQLKPSILRDISEENQLAPQPPRTYFVSDNDKLILEDELQRIRLVGKVDVHKMVTGVVCAVKGYIETDGRFNVEDILYYESGPQKPLPTIKDSKFLVLISGFDQNSASSNEESIKNLQNWLCGEMKNSDKYKKYDPKHIDRVIFAGNSIKATREAKLKSLQIKTTNVVQNVKDFDKFISKIIDSISIEVMPGEHDPANFMLPQQPFNKCMFPISSNSDNFKSTTNPYELELSGRMILGTSGQNIDDITRTSKIEDHLEAACNIIKWGHIAPTCPDTLGCYPYTDKDPFIIKECPHLYFVGNMSEFQTSIHEGSENQKTRIVCIPSFTKTHSIVVVDLKTLDCDEICF